MKRKPWSSNNTVILLAVLGGGLLLGYFHKFLPVTYKPSSPAIEQLAIATTMTPDAQQIFYKQDPSIEPKKRFHSLCHQPGRKPEKTIILGCYINNGYEGNIVIQSVTDARLQGLMEVIAAHEMLHAAYHELSQAERDRLSPKLRQAAKRVKDSRLLSVLEEYESGDPDIYANELHSHLGTELAELGDPDLDQHYQRYFQDRQQVITFAQKSRSTLFQLDAQAEKLKPEIDALETSLLQQKTLILQADRDLEAKAQRLKQMRANLRQLKQEAEAALRRGDTSLAEQFELQKNRLNTEVNQYNSRVQNLQGRVTQLNQQANTYKQKVDTYNELAKTSRSILDSLKVDESEYRVPQLSP